MIAQQAAHLTVFQRTSHYTIPAQHHRLDPDWLAAFKQQYAGYRRRMRVSRGGGGPDSNARRALETPPQQPLNTYEGRGTFGGGGRLVCLADLLADRQAHSPRADV